MMMPLTMAPVGQASKIQRVGGNDETKRFLANLGFVVGSEVTVISAFLVLFNPIIGVGVVVFWVGLSLLLAGVDLIAHAVTLRRLRKEL